MERKIQLSMMLFLAITTVSAAKLKPIYDDDGDNYKLFDIGKELTIQCEPVNGDGKGIMWMKNGADLKHNDHYNINTGEGKLSIRRAYEEDAGNYSCSLDGESHNFDTWARVLVKIPSNSYVVENEKLEITCIVKGTNPEVTWKLAKNVTSDPTSNDYSEIDMKDERFAYEEHDKIPNSRLIIKSALLTDYAYYKCEGTNIVMEKRGEDAADSEGLVRVKDKLAALWPFLGICAEVFILCTIILIYEKRRNKTDLDESDTDQSPDQKNRK